MDEYRCSALLWRCKGYCRVLVPTVAAETAWVGRAHTAAAGTGQIGAQCLAGTFGIWYSEYSRTAAMGARWLRYGSDAATLTASVAAMSRSNDEMRAQVGEPIRCHTLL